MTRPNVVMYTRSARLRKVPTQAGVSDGGSLMGRRASGMAPSVTVGLCSYVTDVRIRR